MLRMMVVTAHPDDEAGNFGGSLRLYAERGVETCVVCLTPGQAATHRGGARDDQELATMRPREFAVSGGHFCYLGIPVGGTEQPLSRSDRRAHQSASHAEVVLLNYGLHIARPATDYFPSCDGCD